MNRQTVLDQEGDVVRPAFSPRDTQKLPRWFDSSRAPGSDRLEAAGILVANLVRRVRAWIEGGSWSVIKARWRVANGE